MNVVRIVYIENYIFLYIICTHKRQYFIPEFIININPHWP